MRIAGDCDGDGIGWSRVDLDDFTVDPNSEPGIVSVFAEFADDDAVQFAAERFRWGRALAAIVALVALGWATTRLGVLSDLVLSDLVRSMQAETPSIELGRELLGLLIVGGWCVLVAVVPLRSPSE